MRELRNNHVFSSVYHVICSTPIASST